MESTDLGWPPRSRPGLRVASGQALAGVVGPLIAVPVLVGFVYVSLWLRRRWVRREAHSRAATMLLVMLTSTFGRAVRTFAAVVAAAGAIGLTAACNDTSPSEEPDTEQEDGGGNDEGGNEGEGDGDD